MWMVEVQLRNTCRGKYLVCSVSTHQKTTVQQHISSCQYRSIVSVLHDLIDYEKNWQAGTERNRIMQLCIQSGWRAIFSDLALPRETARASHTSRGLAIFKHTLGLGAGLRTPQQRLLEPSWNPKQRRCSCNKSLKATTRSNAVFLLPGPGPHRQASRTSCDGRSQMIFHTYLHRPMITQPSPWFSEIRLWGPSPGYGVTWSLLWPLVSGLIPPPPGEERPLQHLWSVCSSCQPSIEDNCLF